MCGIAGVIGRDQDRVREATARMTASLRHRGPDAEGMVVRQFGTGWVGLGHTRLAIQDVTPMGCNPMVHEPTGCEIIHNGEVYNFRRLREELEGEGERFRSRSDAEVVLAGIARHGTSFITRLEGMYAFAVLDERGPESALVIARDPAGIKPLYVAEADGCFLFASEVRAILAAEILRPRVSRQAVAAYLAFGALPQPLSLFGGIRMNPPGAWQVVRARGPGWTADSPTTWWRPPPPEAPAGDIVGETRRLIEGAVRDHLIADVPVGVFLSAGLDSSAVAGFAARYSSDIRAFTVGFRDQPALDEVDTAAETARLLGLSHTPIRISGQDAEAAAEDWLAAADQPSMDGLNTFVISKAVRAEGVKVALSGLGADELFGGYPSFRDVPRLLSLSRRMRWIPPAGRSAIAGLVAAGRPDEVRQKVADTLAGAPSAARLTIHRRRVVSDRQFDQLGLTPADCGLTPDWLPRDVDAGLPHDAPDTLWAVSVVESQFYQANTLLRDADSNGMAHGLEIRVPFLDRRLVDFVHRLPGQVRFPTGRPPKALLRDAAADVLHAHLLNRPKSGFALPLRRWMTGPLRTSCESGLDTLKESGLVNPAGVDTVWRAFLARPEGRVWSRAFTLAVLGDYLRRRAA